MASKFENVDQMATKISKFLQLQQNKVFDNTNQFIFESEQNNEIVNNTFTITFKDMNYSSEQSFKIKMTNFGGESPEPVVLQTNKNHTTVPNNFIEISIKSEDNDITRPLIFIKVDRESLNNDLESVKEIIKPSLSSMPALNSQSHTEPLNKKFNLTNFDLVNLYKKSLLDNKSIDYQTNHKHLVNDINQENVRSIRAFSRQVLSLEVLETYLKDIGNTEQSLLRKGIKPTANLQEKEFNYLQTFREDIFKTILDPKSEEYVEIMNTLANKVGEELPFETINFRVKAEVEVPHTPNKLQQAQKDRLNNHKIYRYK